MQYVDRLLALEAFHLDIDALEQLEATRLYCKHDLTHFLDVARIARIINCENRLGLENEQLYLTALLHDLGRLAEYRDGIDHAIAGRQRAAEHLQAIDYPPTRATAILDAIGTHRHHDQEPNDLSGVISRADTLARPCYRCPAASGCKWPDTRRNHTIRY